MRDILILPESISVHPILDYRLLNRSFQAKLLNTCLVINIARFIDYALCSTVHIMRSSPSKKNAYSIPTALDHGV